MGDAAGQSDQQDVDQAANLVDGQVDQVGLGGTVCRSGVGGADREDGEGGLGEGGEPVPERPASDLVLFKADLGSVSGSVCQVQGVWLDPELRGRGMAPAAMAAVVTLARTVVPTVSLYVNDYNHAARATYDRVGFTQVGEFATIHY